VIIVKKSYLLIGLLAILSVELAFGEDVKYIDSLPYKITESGYYVLKTSCSDLNTTAIIINADNVVLDGNGNILDGKWQNIGVLVNASNVVLKNLVIKQFLVGIEIGDKYSPKTISNIKIINNDLTNYWKDIYLENERCNLIYSTIIIENNTGSGDKPIYYIANKKDTTIDLSYREIPSQIIFANITNCTIKNAICRDGSGIDLVAVRYSILDKVSSSSNYDGITICKSSYNIIRNSKFSNNLHNGIIALLGGNLIITNCTFANNGGYGVYLRGGTYLIYLNNFINNGFGAIAPTFGTVMILHSPTKLTYDYNGKIFTNYLGNYYSDFNGVDENGDGIGDAPYKNIDFYPLIMTFENYIANQNYSELAELDLNGGNILNQIIDNINKTINITNITNTQQMSSILFNETNMSYSEISINTSNVSIILKELNEYGINFSMDNIAYTINQTLESFLGSVNEVAKKISNVVITTYDIIKGLFYLIFGSDDDDFEIDSNNTVYYTPNMIIKQMNKCLNDTK